MTTLARAFAVSRASLAPRRRRARAMATREASYDALKRELATLNDLRSLEGLAGWDELVMMPSGDGAANARARDGDARGRDSRQGDVEGARCADRGVRWDAAR